MSSLSEIVLQYLHSLSGNKKQELGKQPEIRVRKWLGQHHQQKTTGGKADTRMEATEARAGISKYCHCCYSSPRNILHQGMRNLSNIKECYQQSHQLLAQRHGTHLYFAVHV